MNELYYEYKRKLDDEHEAIRRVCMKWDIYYDKSIFLSCKNSSTNQKIVGDYLRNLNLSKKYGCATYDDTLARDRDTPNNPSIQSLEDLKEVEVTEKPTQKMVKTWGFGFQLEDYVYLSEQFDDWKARVVIDSKSRETLIRDLCVIKLHQQKAISSSDIDTYNKLQKTYQDTLSSANLKPIQVDANDKASEKPMGVMIEMFENDRPIPQPNPEWEDVDGILKLVTVYFIGHLCKMLGLKNKYSKMYEDEMQAYRVEMPELEDSDDEDVFDYLINNTGNENGDVSG
jgi:hypothetical protein